MISARRIGLIAVITPVWFVGVYLVMASRRPEYSHLTKAISELGSLDAPNLWVWNVLGYVLPGLAVALLGVGLWREFAGLGRKATVPTMALLASGLFMALSGVFPGDFDNRSSLTMVLHTLSSLGSFVVFLVAGFGLPQGVSSAAGLALAGDAVTGVGDPVDRYRFPAQWRGTGTWAAIGFRLLLRVDRVGGLCPVPRKTRC